MIQVSVLYPASEDMYFDADYYLNKHMPMSINLQGKHLRSTQVVMGISGVTDGTKPPFTVMCHFHYDSLDAFLAAFLPHQEQLTADMENYTTIQPTIQISQVCIET